MDKECNEDFKKKEEKDMIVVRIQGGLGNQMFQYALYEWLLSNEKDVKLDISSYSMNVKKSKVDTVHNGYELERIFNLNPSYASYREACEVGDISRDVINRVRRSFLGKKKTHITRDTLNSNGWYSDDLLAMDDVYLDGYWCTFKYSEAIKETIIDRFSFAEVKDKANKDIIEKIKGCNSVSLHIRHGDYLNLTDRFCALDENYYYRAIKKIKEQVENPVFFCFSDDIEWCKENIKEDNIFFIDWNKKENSFMDMQLMSLCSHNILANSTFSMWGAWLNKNSDKIVIRPKKVFVDPQNEISDFWPEEWIILDN